MSKHCNDFPNIPCCVSCHEDEEEYGYDLIHSEFKADEIYVCCSVSNALNELTNEAQERGEYE